MNDVTLSKFLSLVLRHEPERLGLHLDSAGWVGVDVLLAACATQRVPLTLAKLEQIVAASEKQRFAFDETKTHIRANQGHSVKVELGYEPEIPPELLYHGTVEKFLPSISEHGLLKRERHHVHLSGDEATARQVGARRGVPVILAVKAGAMYRAGYQFFRSTNGVWLVEQVPTEHLEIPN